MKVIKLGPFGSYVVMTEVEYIKKVADVMASNLMIKSVKDKLLDIFGTMQNAYRILDRAAILAFDFMDSKAKLEAKFCEYTGKLKTECSCGGH